MQKKQLLFEKWKMASELHREEDRLIWQRFSYFVTLTSILISGFGLVLTQKKVAPDYREYALLFVSTFGVAVSWTFLLMFRRAYFYHLYRLDQARRAEKSLHKAVFGEYEQELIYDELTKEKLPKKVFWLLGSISTNRLIHFLTFLIVLGWLGSIAGVVYVHYGTRYAAALVLAGIFSLLVATCLLGYFIPFIVKKVQQKVLRAKHTLSKAVQEEVLSSSLSSQANKGESSTVEEYN